MDSSAHPATVDLEIGNENYVAADSKISNNKNYVATNPEMCSENHVATDLEISSENCTWKFFRYDIFTF